MGQLDLLRRITELEAENERLRAKLVAAETYGEKERGHFEDWFKRACEAEVRIRDLEAERTLAVKARDNWREAHDQAQARTRTLEAALELYRRYAKLLAKSEGEGWAIASLHGMRCPGEYIQEGVALREAIDAALTEPTPPICAGGIEPTDTWHPRQEPPPPQEEPR